MQVCWWDAGTDETNKGTSMATKQQESSEQAVLVTTAHRGVFFGYLVGEASKEKVMLKKARNCVSWTAQAKGVFGLAEIGPSDDCRIGPQVAELTLWDITAVATVSADAVKRWEKSPWVR